jgi:hypothetical protein
MFARGQEKEMLSVLIYFCNCGIQTVGCKLNAQVTATDTAGLTVT